MKHYRIVALPGEGIGPEVVEGCLRILEAIATQKKFTVAVDFGWIGETAKQQFGEYLPQETLRLCEGSDGILFGSVTKGGLLELRKHFDLFANLRPVRPSPSLIELSPIKTDRLKGVDLLFVRELVSGIYFGEARRESDGGFHTMRYADAEIRRVAKVALQYAQARRRRLCVAHKENALPHLHWRRLVEDEAQAFPAVTVEPMLVDNLAMQLVVRPQDFDVVLAGNLFGDILSDLGGAIAGSIGLLGSASLNANGFGMYEAVHGTAPDIAGQGIANPLGTLAGMILMLQQWGEISAAQTLIAIQEKLLAQGYRTADLFVPKLAQHQQMVSTAELINLFITSIREVDR